MPELADINAWSVWKRLELGRYKDLGEFKKALMKKGAAVGESYEIVFNAREFKLSTERTTIDLVNPAIFMDLKLQPGTPYSEVSERAAFVGLKTCPPEIPIHCLIQYPTPQPGEWFLFPIVNIPSPRGIINMIVLVGTKDDWEVGLTNVTEDHIFKPHQRLIYWRPS